MRWKTPTASPEFPNGASRRAFGIGGRGQKLEDEMHYRFQKNERISEIGLGGYALSGVYGKKDPEQFINVIRRAYDLGVTFFDVADIYGPAEEILGRAVASFRQKVWIATKVGWTSEGKPDCSPEHFFSSCEQSLKRLKTDYLDLYQIHFNDPDTPVESTVGALQALRIDGKIRHYGVGHLPLDRLSSYIEIGSPFSEMAELSAVARSARERILPLCQARNVGVIGFSVTGRGLLTGKIGPGQAFEQGDLRLMDPLFQRERFTSGLRVGERFRALGKKYGKTSAQVAIAWVLAQPGLLCALTGPSTIPHLEENLGASGWVIDEADLVELEFFFNAEDKRLMQEQAQSIRIILTQDLHPERGFNDLLYALESLVEIKVASEEEVMPYLQKLLQIREMKDSNSADQLREIQTALQLFVN